MTATMLAVRQRCFGGLEVLEVVEAQRPRVDPTEVLVAVRGAGVNPVDWVTRAGEVHLKRRHAGGRLSGFPGFASLPQDAEQHHPQSH